MDDSEKFRQESYNIFDGNARDAVRSWMDLQGLYSVSVEDYGADIKVANIVGGKLQSTSRHELEVRCCWESDKKFPYSTVSIPLRKEKLFDQGIKDLFFWSVSGDYKKGMFVRAHIVNQCARISKMTLRGEGGFFSVPLEYYRVVSLDGK